MNYGIGNVKGGGGVSNTMLTTTTDATENNGTYTLDLTYLSETPKVNDYVVYVNSGNLTTLYKVSAVGSTEATLTKIGDIGGANGNPLYLHSVYIYYKVGTSNYAFFGFDILNNDDTTINTYSKLAEALYNAGYTSSGVKSGCGVVNGKDAWCLFSNDGTSVSLVYNNSSTPEFYSLPNSATISDNPKLLGNSNLANTDLCRHSIIIKQTNNSLNYFTISFIVETTKRASLSQQDVLDYLGNKGVIVGNGAITSYVGNQPTYLVVGITLNNTNLAVKCNKLFDTQGVGIMGSITTIDLSGTGNWTIETDRLL